MTRRRTGPFLVALVLAAAVALAGCDGNERRQQRRDHHSQ